MPTGIFPCADGYVSLLSTPQQLEEMLDVLDNDDLRHAFSRPDAFIRGETKELIDAALYPWLFEHTRAEATAAAQASGWPFAGVYTPSEVLEVDHLHQRNYWNTVEDPELGTVRVPGAPYRHTEGGWRIARPAPRLGEHDQAIDAELRKRPLPRVARTSEAPELQRARPPLEGVRVLDMTTVWSGPFVTQLLADLGAEVIRLENPYVYPPTTKGLVPRPERSSMHLGHLLAMYAPLRDGCADRPYNRHAMNNSIARNKLSCTLDPRQPEGHSMLMRLVEISDVFVENLKATTLHKLGIFENELLQRNPNLVVLRIPPAGLSGDWATYTGFGAQFDGLSGFAHLTGHHDTEMVDTPSTAYMDAATGAAGALAVVSALHYRSATGRGQVVELAQVENVIAHLGDVLVECQRGESPARRGNRDPHAAPQGVYPCRGEHRWLAISITNDHEWISLTQILGHPELTNDPRFSTAEGRYTHHDEIDSHIRSWTYEQDLLGAFHMLQEAGIPAGPQFDDDMLITDPHVIARQSVKPLAGRDVGSYLHISHAVRGIPQAWWRASPGLGEDNEYVYRKLLGLDDDEFERLQELGIITNDYLDANGIPV
jgi:crotonobetainyl-CoA:carnitine CoA-transferase CaiB-like acyl-CoA transferase